MKKAALTKTPGEDQVPLWNYTFIQRVKRFFQNLVKFK